MERTRSGCAEIRPSPRPEILVYSYPAGIDAPRRKIRENQRKVPDLGHDGVGLVRTALTMPSRMNVDVGHDVEIEIPAKAPHGAQLPPVKFDYPVPKAGRVDIVVIDEPFDAVGRATFASQQKRAALADARRPPPKLQNTGPPDRARADQFRRPTERRADER